MLDCMEPADPRGEVEVEVKAEAATRGIVHDSQTLFFFLAKLMPEQWLHRNTEQLLPEEALSQTWVVNRDPR